MNIDGVTLKSQCSNCGKDILLTYNITTQIYCYETNPRGTTTHSIHVITLECLRMNWSVTLLRVLYIYTLTYLNVK